ncbi:MAG: thiamine-phosphate kinase [Syntrophobacterales bacterium]|nr:MAG: thiamine-phosphate kinase [Syntrophobacterales bacterium]
MPLTDSNIAAGIGDDAAVMKPPTRSICLVTTDILIEDIHFTLDYTDPIRLGKKALSINLSDIAAMGGTPQYFLLSMGLPLHLPFRWVEELFQGIQQVAERYNLSLIGGDTSLARKVTINITLIGRGKAGEITYRKGAQPGDQIMVTGTLGNAALGLRILESHKGDSSISRTEDNDLTELIEKHLSPIPRIAEGRLIAKNHLASAMIDISDGLMADLGHILEESHAGAKIWVSQLPLSEAYRRKVLHYTSSEIDLAISGGEDYELLLTTPRKKGEKLLGLFKKSGLKITPIGEIADSRYGLRLFLDDGREYRPMVKGYDHFKNRGK